MTVLSPLARTASCFARGAPTVRSLARSFVDGDCDTVSTREPRDLRGRTQVQSHANMPPKKTVHKRHSKLEQYELECCLSSYIVIMQVLDAVSESQCGQINSVRTKCSFTRVWVLFFKVCRLYNTLSSVLYWLKNERYGQNVSLPSPPCCPFIPSFTRPQECLRQRPAVTATALQLTAG